MSSTRLTGLVLDLRNDPGGLLKSAVDLSSDFLEGGSIVPMHGRDKSDNRSFEAAATGTLLPKTPMVVLVNGASASASEIVAGEPKKKKHPPKQLRRRSRKS